jgi:predicted CoA-binding protein
VRAERAGISDDPRIAEYQNPRDILEILQGARTVAVLGLSPDELRASNFVGFYLQRHGYRVVPVNPLVDEILGERSYPSVMDIPFRVDVVDVFRKPEAVPAIAKEAVAAGVGALWLQFGVINFEGAEIAAA